MLLLPVREPGGNRALRSGRKVLEPRGDPAECQGAPTRRRSVRRALGECQPDGRLRSRPGHCRNSGLENLSDRISSAARHSIIASGASAGALVFHGIDGEKNSLSDAKGEVPGLPSMCPTSRQDQKDTQMAGMQQQICAEGKGISLRETFDPQPAAADRPQCDGKKVRAVNTCPGPVPPSAASRSRAAGSCPHPQTVQHFRLAGIRFIR